MGNLKLIYHNRTNKENFCSEKISFCDHQILIAINTTNYKTMSCLSANENRALSVPSLVSAVSSQVQQCQGSIIASETQGLTELRLSHIF